MGIQTWIADGESAVSAEAKAEFSQLQSVVVVRRDLLADDAVVFTLVFHDQGEAPPPPPPSPEPTRVRGPKFWLKQIAGEWLSAFSFQVSALS